MVDYGGVGHVGRENEAVGMRLERWVGYRF